MISPRTLWARTPKFSMQGPRAEALRCSHYATWFRYCPRHQKGRHRRGPYHWHYRRHWEGRYRHTSNSPMITQSWRTPTLHILVPELWNHAKAALGTVHLSHILPRQCQARDQRASQIRRLCIIPRMHTRPITLRVQGCTTRWLRQHPGMVTHAHCSRPYATMAILGSLGSAPATSLTSAKCDPGSPQTCFCHHSIMNLDRRHGEARRVSR